MPVVHSPLFETYYTLETGYSRSETRNSCIMVQYVCGLD